MLAGRDTAVMRSRKELEEVCQRRRASLNAVEFEDVAAATDWLRASPKGKLGLAWIIPSLKTWSRLPHFNRRGRPPVRSGEHPWGLPWVKHESGEFATLQAANREVLNLIQLSKELLVHSPKVASCIRKISDSVEIRIQFQFGNCRSSDAYRASLAYSVSRPTSANSESQSFALRQGSSAQSHWEKPSQRVGRSSKVLPD